MQTNFPCVSLVAIALVLVAVSALPELAKVVASLRRGVAPNAQVVAYLPTRYVEEQTESREAQVPYDRDGLRVTDSCDGAKNVARLPAGRVAAVAWHERWVPKASSAARLWCAAWPVRGKT